MKQVNHTTAPAIRDITQRPPGSPSISVEVLVWTSLIVIATALRLAGLDRFPFTVAEAGHSFDAFLVAEGQVSENWRGDLLAALTSYAFRVFGDTELVARAIPATAGSALLMAVWFLRSHFGRVSALVAATLIAFSPLFVLLSRAALPFVVGALIAVIMSAALLSYLKAPRHGTFFALALAVALAPLTDAVAVTALVAVVVFVGMEATIIRNRAVLDAWDAFRRSPLQWVTAAFVSLAALQLGITHFGNTIGGIGPPGLALWWDMFRLPRDGQPWDYHLTLLLAYDWPLLLTGVGAVAYFAARASRGGIAAITPYQRFLLVWSLLATVSLVLAGQREAGQTLILLLPIALLVGCAAQDIFARMEWDSLRQWWPAPASAVLLLAMSAMLMTTWASGSASTLERLLLAFTAGGAMLLVAVPTMYLRRHGLAVPLVVLAAAVLAFSVHSSFTVARGEGGEFALGPRLLPRAEAFRDTLDELIMDRGGHAVASVDTMDTLGWTLRNSNVVFGGPVDGASVVIDRPTAELETFVALGDVWRIDESWSPDTLIRGRSLWRWLLFREPFTPTESLELRFYVPTV